MTPHPLHYRKIPAHFRIMAAIWLAKIPENFVLDGIHVITYICGTICSAKFRPSSKYTRAVVLHNYMAEDIATGKSVALNSHRLTIDTAGATTSHWLVIDTARCHYKPQNSY